jgi:hypothetical protein
MSAVGIQAIVDKVYAVNAYTGEEKLVVTDSPDPPLDAMSLSGGRLILHFRTGRLKITQFSKVFYDTSRKDHVSLDINQTTEIINLVRLTRIYKLFTVVCEKIFIPGKEITFTIEPNGGATDMRVMCTNLTDRSYEIKISYMPNWVYAHYSQTGKQIIPLEGEICDATNISKLYPALVKFFTPPKSFFSKQEEDHQLWCKIEQLTDALCERLDIH